MYVLISPFTYDEHVLAVPGRDVPDAMVGQLVELALAHGGQRHRSQAEAAEQAEQKAKESEKKREFNGGGKIKGSCRLKFEHEAEDSELCPLFRVQNAFIWLKILKIEFLKL